MPSDPPPGCAATSARRPRAARLRSEREVREVLRRGHAAHGRCMSVHVCERHGPTRTTVVAGRRVGGAVARNRAKRRLRAVLSEIRLPASRDLVVVARPRMRELSHDELRAALAEQVRRAVR